MSNVKFNAGAALAALTRARATLTDMTPIFFDVADYMLGATKRRFIEGKAPDGSKWAPKKQSTIDHYKRLGYGRLPRPLIGPGGMLSEDIFTQYSRNSAVIGSALIYSRVMQEGAEKGAFGRTKRGGPIPWGRIPARVWLGISKADEAVIVDIADEHIERALGDRGQ